MAGTITFEINLENAEKAAAEFFPAFGSAMAEWANIERALYYWFLGITQMKEGMARAIFYSAKGFGARADLIEAAINHASRQTEAEIAFIRAALKKTRAYSQFRNRLAHGEMAMDITSHEGEISSQDGLHFINDRAPKLSYSIGQGRDVSGQVISVEDIETATDNFSTLKEALLDMIPEYRPEDPKSPEEYLALVVALPNQPQIKSVREPVIAERETSESHRKRRFEKATRSLGRGSLARLNVRARKLP